MASESLHVLFLLLFFSLMILAETAGFLEPASKPADLLKTVQNIYTEVLRRKKTLKKKEKRERNIVVAYHTYNYCIPDVLENI